MPRIKCEIKKIHIFYFKKFCFLTAYFQSDRRCILEEFTHQDNYLEFLNKIRNIQNKNNFSVFDIGANVGWLSLFLNLFLNKKTKYFLFEPLKENINLLKKNFFSTKLMQSFPYCSFK